MRDNYDDKNDSPQKPSRGTVFYKILIVMFLLVLLGGVYIIDTQLGNGYIKNAISTVAGLNGSEESKSGEAAKSKSVSQSTSEDDTVGITIGETDEPEEEDADKTSVIDKAMKFESNSKSTFAIMDKGFVHCSKDGVKFYNNMDNQKWNSTFTMTSPVMLTEGNYVAVGESGGKNVKVYNEDGEVYSLKIEGMVERIALNKNGYIAIMSSLSDYYRIQIFDNKGTEITKREEKDKGVYPLDMDISDDNNIFAVSYVDTSDVTLVGKVVFFYTYKEKGKEVSDAMFSAVSKEDEIIPEIEFMNGNKLITVTDKNIYAFNQKGNEEWFVKLKNKIQAVSFDGKDKVVLAYGEPLSTSEGENTVKIEWIDNNGKVSGSYEGDENVTYLKAGKGTAIFGNHNTYKAVSEKGNELWEYKAKQDITDILFMNGTDNVLCVTKTSAEIMDMKNNTK